ncbi:MAG: hypothetical protein R2747_19150 [Pyrinomonadaceae bacterium]
MIGRSFFFILLSAALAPFVFGQRTPTEIVTLEKKAVTPERELILWMKNPKKTPRDPEMEIYTCPEETRGHYYNGKAYVSLVNTKTKKVINVLEIKGSEVTGDGEALDLPYLIHRGYYDVPEIDENREGKPVLMNLKDYNDDGRAFEFALYDAVACMGLETTLIGYSPKRDRVIQYQTELKTGDKTFQKYWVDYFFPHRPVKKMFWQYEIDYRGRGGAIDKYEIRYDQEKEKFFGTLKFETGDTNQIQFKITK